jgi:hypothetical protein
MAHRLRARLLGRHRFLSRVLRVRAGRLRRRFALPRPAPSRAAQIQRLRELPVASDKPSRLSGHGFCKVRWS